MVSERLKEDVTCVPLIWRSLMKSNANGILIDAEGQTLGRLASEAASILRGKHKPQFTPHVDTGDFVIIINAEKIIVTGNKLQDKFYYRHSGYPGGLKKTSLKDMLNKHPERALQTCDLRYAT